MSAQPRTDDDDDEQGGGAGWVALVIGLVLCVAGSIGWLSAMALAERLAMTGRMW